MALINPNIGDCASESTKQALHQSIYVKNNLKLSYGNFYASKKQFGKEFNVAVNIPKYHQFSSSLANQQ
jgi:hypothetical protein